MTTTAKLKHGYKVCKFKDFYTSRICNPTIVSTWNERIASLLLLFGNLRKCFYVRFSVLSVCGNISALHSHLSSPIDKTTMLYLIPLKNQINL